MDMDMDRACLHPLVCVITCEECLWFPVLECVGSLSTCIIILMLCPLTTLVDTLSHLLLFSLCSNACSHNVIVLGITYFSLAVAVA